MPLVRVLGAAEELAYSAEAPEPAEPAFLPPGPAAATCGGLARRYTLTVLRITSVRTSIGCARWATTFGAAVPEPIARPTSTPRPPRVTPPAVINSIRRIWATPLVG